MVPLLDKVEAERRAPCPGERKRRGRPSQYTGHDFERPELLRRIRGKTSTQATRDWLTTDRAASTRKVFGPDRDRPHFDGRPRFWMAGVRCDGTMSDYRVKCFTEADRASTYRLLERWLLVEKLHASPDGDQELDCIYADGSQLETHSTPPKKRAGTRSSTTNRALTATAGCARPSPRPTPATSPTAAQRRPRRRRLEHHVPLDHQRHRPRLHDIGVVENIPVSSDSKPQKLEDLRPQPRQSPHRHRRPPELARRRPPSAPLHVRPREDRPAHQRPRRRQDGGRHSG